MDAIFDLLYRLNRQIVLSALGAIIVIESAFYILIVTENVGFDRRLSWTVLIAVPGFGLTILGLAQSVMLQRGAFVKDYIAQFFLKPELIGAWQDLIYNFDDDLFSEVERFVKENNLAAHKERPILLALDEEGIKRWGNVKIYYPYIFQGSEEEKRLDALMGYLNVIGYYHNRGLISTRDIYGSLGYFLLLLQDREAATLHRQMIKDEWGRQERYNRVVPHPPYSYMESLLDVLVKHRDRIRRRTQKPGGV